MKNLTLLMAFILITLTLNAQVTDTGSNVGIGTSSPSMKLQIVGSAATGYNNTLSLDENEWFNFGNISGYGFINWFAQANTNRNDLINTHSSVKASSIRGSNGEIRFYTSLANNGIGQSSGLIERMSIESNGNIGIGISNPSEKLTVNGKILCEEVEVVLDATAPDYVFEKYYNGYSNLKTDYVMPTLEEVESYTKANNHLPDVPSAATLKEDGLQLKDMSLILLQKIEELTLYTIEQEKRIKSLEAKIAE